MLAALRVMKPDPEEGIITFRLDIRHIPAFAYAILALKKQ